MKHRRWPLALALVIFVVALILFGVDSEDPPAPEASAGVEGAPRSASHPTKKRQVRKSAPAPREVPPSALGAPEADPSAPWAEELEPEADREDKAPPIRMGSLARSSIDEGIRDVMPEIRACYQEALAAVPDLAGQLRIKFTIEEEEGSGWVKEVSVPDADFDDVPMEDCVMDVVESVAFDPPEGGGVVIVSYPFVFSQSE